MWDGASEDCTGALRNERGASALVRLRRPSRQSTHVHTSPARETRASRTTQSSSHVSAEERATQASGAILPWSHFDTVSMSHPF